MKHLFTLKTIMLACLLFVGMGAWGQNYVLNTTDPKNIGSNNAYASACDVTVDGITWNVTGNASLYPWRLGGKSITNTDRNVYSKTAYSHPVDKITVEIGEASSVTINSIKLIHSTSSDFSNATTINASGTAANTTYTFQPDGGFPKDSYFKFVFNVTVSATSNKFVEFKNVKIYNKAATEAYTVTFNAGANGTCSTSSLTEASAGAGVTVPDVTPNAGYRFKGWSTIEDTYTAATLTSGVFKPTENCTLYAFYDREYSANIYINGAQSGATQYLIAGEAITFPADPADINGKKFQGWTKTADYSNATTAPSDLCKEANMGTADVTYYAVFATQTGTPETHNIITYQTTNFPSSYATSRDCSLNGVSFNITQAYVNGQKTQWRASGNSNGTGTMYNNDAMDISKITLTYDASDSNKNFTIKVGNSANPTSGTQITGVADKDNTNVYVFDCSSENASYFVLTNGVNAGYLTSIDITCGGTTCSDYCTTVAPAPTSVDVTISAAGYATFYDAVHKVELPAGVSGYVAYMDGETFIFGEAYEPGHVVPAGEPIVLKGAGNVTLNFSDETAQESWKEAGMNDLIGTATDITAEQMADANPGMGRFYALSLNASNELSSVGFYWMNETGAAFALGAGKCYFALPAAAAVKGFRFNNTTGIKDVKTAALNGAAFNLNGQRVAANAKGIVIVNGKKMLNK